MDRLEYEDYENFACEIVNKFDSLENEFDDISIIAKYDEAKEIIKKLLFVGFDINSLEIYSNDYYEEYIISIDSDMSVWCEKFKRETGYINDTPSVAYVMDNCNSAVFKHINSDEIYEVCIGENDDEKTQSTSLDTNNSESIYISRSKDGTPEGFSKSWFTVEDGITCYSSYSHYSNDINALKDIASDFGVKL